MAVLHSHTSIRKSSIKTILVKYFTSQCCFMGFYVCRSVYPHVISIDFSFSLFLRLLCDRHNIYLSVIHRSISKASNKKNEGKLETFNKNKHVFLTKDDRILLVPSLAPFWLVYFCLFIYFF